ncbi:MAG: Co2+/Mg2+ efflux protein ApaG [Bauldia sp.]
MYRATTRSIRVTVTPSYLGDRSSPGESRYYWAYTIEIVNLGLEVVQLKAREWHITDALGRHQSVVGPGVVGEQPVLQPGESFEYTSGCPLTTTSGIMVGHYEMRTEAGETFTVDIPAFSLDVPNAERQLN